MKKPHETTLSIEQFDNKRRRCLVEDGKRMVAVLRAHEADAWEAFLPAAPDMARALLALLKHEVGATRHTDACWEAPSLACTEDCAAIHAALRKAKVLP